MADGQGMDRKDDPLSDPGTLQSYVNNIQSFWLYAMRDDPDDEFKNHQLPLARIKKIMKSDEDVRMISADAPVLFAKACEMFILELTLRAWVHTTDNRRKTLQRGDIGMAITKTDIFDFLIDIVPREDAKANSKKLNNQLGAPGTEEVTMVRAPGQLEHNLAQYYAMTAMANGQVSAEAASAYPALFLYQQQLGQLGQHNLRLFQQHSIIPQLQIQNQALPAQVAETTVESGDSSQNAGY